MYYEHVVIKVKCFQNILSIMFLSIFNDLPIFETSVRAVSISFPYVDSIYSLMILFWSLQSAVVSFTFSLILSFLRAKTIDIITIKNKTPITKNENISVSFETQESGLIDSISLNVIFFIV